MTGETDEPAPPKVWSWQWIYRRGYTGPRIGARDAQGEFKLTQPPPSKRSIWR